VSATVAIALPLLVMFAMFIVGLELTPADLANVLRFPAQVATALAGQFLLLPLIAAAVIVAFRPEPSITGGLILTVAAPQAMSANLFCVLGRSNVALSVALTVASSVIALVSTPLVAAFAFDLLLEQHAGFAVPIGPVMMQILTGFLLPVAAGMLVRRYAPVFIEHNRARLQVLTLAIILATLAAIFFDQATMVRRNLASIVVVAIVFTLGAAALGWGIARAFAWNRADTVTLLVAYPLRSLSVAALVAVNVLGRLDFLAFAASFYLLQALLLVPAMLVARRAAPA
jgi:BASS family bile acid:Na+ symporter